ncbi:MAG: DUF971 domain-containing protein [Acidobacteriia bacterium]|nr:DUF971 domain-containing protein [Terriglobia bacterium]
MPLPLDSRKKPAGVKVHVTTGQGVEITWSDGHASQYAFPYLRDHCPCSLCNEERAKKDQAKATHGSSAVLPMFKPRVTAKAAAAVGNYALQIEFSDGHATGIFSFDHLREICPCEACGKEFRGAAPGNDARN